MEEMNHIRIWSLAKEKIRLQLSEMMFNAWIEILTPVAYTNRVLVLEVHDGGIRETLKGFYSDILLDAVKDAEPGAAGVELVLPEEAASFRAVPRPEPVRERAAQSFNLNPKNTFDNFVVGKCNEFAHSAALATAGNPGGTYNPLFIYGGVGLGKTHLMQAIGNYAYHNDPTIKVQYVPCETFTYDLILAIQKDKRLEFRQKYRTVDILMIDDVQFMAKSNATQEEFFNIFNELHNAGKQIVISADRPPQELNSLEERLVSRFSWGLAVDITPPELETRVAILQNKADLDGISVPDGVLRFIAEHVSGNVRELEGCLTRVNAYATLKRRPVTTDLAAEALKDILKDVRRRELTPGVIKETVADFYGVSVDSMDSQRRDQEVVLPRQVAMYLCHTLLDVGYSRTAQLFNRGDHTTAINACKKVQQKLEADQRFAAEVEDIQKRL